MVLNNISLGILKVRFPQSEVYKKNFGIESYVCYDFRNDIPRLTLESFSGEILEGASRDFVLNEIQYGLRKKDCS